MERDQQLTAMKRLRLAQGATPERFEYEAEDLMAQWGVSSGVEAVDYLKRAVAALPKKHAEALSAMFGFTYTKKALEGRRTAYAEKIGRAVATVKRAEAVALDALLDQLTTQPKGETTPEYLERMFKETSDPIYAEQLRLVNEIVDGETLTPDQVARFHAMRGGYSESDPVDNSPLTPEEQAEFDAIVDRAEGLAAPLKARLHVMQNYNALVQTATEHEMTPQDFLWLWLKASLDNQSLSVATFLQAKLEETKRAK